MRYARSMITHTANRRPTHPPIISAAIN
uniref:Uncharacterized protein n=1 Tax=Ciona intestinalis TaxID=7719 RepID=H2XSV9_CIOIN